MAQAIPVLKDAALQEYYEDLFAMYATPGWKKLMEDVAHLAQTHDTVAGLETTEQLWHRKGELLQIEWLKNHQAATEFAYQQMLAEQEGGANATAGVTGGEAKVVR